MRFFHFFKILIGVKGQKILMVLKGKKWLKVTKNSVALRISEIIHHMIVIYGTHV